MVTRKEHMDAALEAARQGKLEVAAYNALVAVAIGQEEFLAAIEAMKNQGPPQVGGTRMMTCGNTIGSNACKGSVSEQVYILTHQDGGNSTFRFKCLKCNTLTDVKRVATASLPPELQPPPKVAPTGQPQLG